MESSRLSIFVSSTLRDLIPERDAVVRALGSLPYAFRPRKEVKTFFGHAGETGRPSFDEIERCDVYVGIFGALYSGIVEAEYQRARERNLPCFIYIKSESSVRLGKYYQDPEHRARLEQFKGELRAAHAVSEFFTADELANKLYADLLLWATDPARPTNLPDREFVVEMMKTFGVVSEDLFEDILSSLSNGELMRSEVAELLHKVSEQQHSVASTDHSQPAAPQLRPEGEARQVPDPTPEARQPLAESPADVATDDAPTTAAAPEGLEDGEPAEMGDQTAGSPPPTSEAQPAEAPGVKGELQTLAELLAQKLPVGVSERTRTNLRYAGEIGRPISQPISALLFLVATLNRSSESDAKDTGLFLMKALQRQRVPRQDKSAFIKWITIDLLEEYGVTGFRQYEGVEGPEAFLVGPAFYDVMRVASELAREADVPELNPRHVIGAILSPRAPRTDALWRLVDMNFDVLRLRVELLEFIDREHHDEIEAWRKYLTLGPTEEPPDVAVAGPRLAEQDASASDAMHTVSDQPTSDDSLGFGPYVRSVAEFLTDAETEPPITVSVEGDWGSGKSSFMLQLEKRLRDDALSARLNKLLAACRRLGLARPDPRRAPRWLRRCLKLDRRLALYALAWPREDVRRSRALIVRFNAWRHDKEDALWAAFALEFVKQLSHQLTFAERWRARLSLLSRRSNWPARLAALRAASLALLVAALTFSLAWFAAAGGYSQLLQQVSDGGSLDDGKIFRLLAEGSGLAGYAAFLVYIVTKLREHVGDPLAVSIKQYLDAPDYEGRVSFIESFHDDFNKIVETYAGDEKVYVFVDDLDRCEVPKAADLMQALNLLIADSSNLIFVLGMDREKVAAGLAVKYEKLLPYIGAAGTLAVNGDKAAAKAGAGASSGNGPGTGDAKNGHGRPSNDPALGLEYGYAFIEKFVQIPFRVPQPGDPELGKLLEKLSERRKPASAAVPPRAATARPIKPVQPATEHPPSIPEPVSVGAAPEPAVAGDVSGAPSAQRPSGTGVDAPPAELGGGVALAREAAREARAAEFKRGASGDEERVRKIALLVAPALDRNVRRLKQFLNLFRLRAYIAANLGVPVTYEQLGKFVAISLQWPRLVAEIEDDRDLLLNLQRSANGEPAGERMAEYLRQRPRLAALLKEGCDGESRHLYSFEGVEVSKLVIVAAPPPQPAANVPTATTVAPAPADTARAHTTG